MWDWIKMILIWAGLVGLFFYFCAADISDTSGYTKIRVSTKNAGNGWVIRIKSTGWEVWKLERRVETSKVFPPSLKDLMGSSTSPK